MGSNPTAGTTAALLQPMAKDHDGHVQVTPALILPMLYNYRHSIELALKAVIRDAAECGRRDGLDNSELDPDNVNKSLNN
ncbi:MAG: hypothetical protein ACRDQU_01830 [Pseudonocardiaceae bacterium]